MPDLIKIRGFLGSVAVMVETHIFTTHRQRNNRWNEETLVLERSKKFVVQKSVVNVLASIFWNYQGVVMINFLNEGGTLIDNYYSALLTTL